MALMLLFAFFIFAGLPAEVINIRWVTFYENWRYEGKSISLHLPLGRCQNILAFNDRTSSLKTDYCIRLWEHIDCTGKFLDVNPPGIMDLGPTGFNDQTTSVNDCSSGGNGGNSNPGSGKWVTLYENWNYEGRSIRLELPVGGCRNIFEFNDQTSSVKTDSCIRLWENNNCSGKNMFVYPPGINDLGPKGLNDQTTSISDC